MSFEHRAKSASCWLQVGYHLFPLRWPEIGKGFMWTWNQSSIFNLIEAEVNARIHSPIILGSRTQLRITVPWWDFRSLSWEGSPVWISFPFMFMAKRNTSFRGVERLTDIRMSKESPPPDSLVPLAEALTQFGITRFSVWERLAWEQKEGSKGAKGNER